MAYDFSDLGPSSGTATAESKLDFSDLGPAPEKSLGGFAKNAWQDVKENAEGLGNLGKGLLTHPIDTATQTIANIPTAIMNEGKRLGGDELLKGNFMNAGGKFLNAAYNKPVTTGLELYGGAEALGKGAGLLGEEAAGANAASETARMIPKGESEFAAKAAPAAIPPLPEAENISRVAPESPPPINLGEEAFKILKEKHPSPPPASPEESAPLGKIMPEIAGQIPDTVKDQLGQVWDHIESKYGQMAAKPGFTNTAADYMDQHSQNMALKEMGASPGQVRKIGIDKARALADYALENDLVGPKIGSIGREQKVAQDLETAGGAVGGFRKMAADRGAVHNVDDLINQIKTKLDPKYTTPGIYSGGQGMYENALTELKKLGGRADNIADKVSELFQESKKQDRLKQPSGPISDVARAARDINHDLISKVLTPEEKALYEQSLEHYGALTQINEFVKRRASTEGGGRLGPGSGISRAGVQKFLDAVGYRTEAKVMKGLADKIRQNPDIVSTPQNLFRHYIDEAAEAVDEMGEGLH